MVKLCVFVNVCHILGIVAFLSVKCLSIDNQFVFTVCSFNFCIFVVILKDVSFRFCYVFFLLGDHIVLFLA